MRNLKGKAGTCLAFIACKARQHAAPRVPFLLPSLDAEHVEALDWKFFSPACHLMLVIRRGVTKGNRSIQASWQEGR